MDIPSLVEVAKGRPLPRSIDPYPTLARATGLLRVAVFGDRRAPRATARGVECLDSDDRSWLGGSAPRKGGLTRTEAEYGPDRGARVPVAVSGPPLSCTESGPSVSRSECAPPSRLADLGTAAPLPGHLRLALILPETAAPGAGPPAPGSVGWGVRPTRGAHGDRGRDALKGRGPRPLNSRGAASGIRAPHRRVRSLPRERPRRLRRRRTRRGAGAASRRA
jgi:hypothetical protein